MPKYNLPDIHTQILTKKFLSISKAAKFLQVSPDTLRNWEKQGKLIPTRTLGGARRYSSIELSILKKEIQPFLVKHKGLLNISQAAKQLGVSTDTLRNWTRKGLIDNQRTKGGARRFTRSEINRVQDELGIEPKHVTNFQPEIHNFSFPWRIIQSSILIGLILIIGSKVVEVSGMVGKLAKSIESLQSGVYGIQTEMVPSPTPISSPSPSLPSQVITYIQTASSLIQSATEPISLENGVVGCKACLVNSLNYMSGVENLDGSLNVSTQDKVSKVSLETNHTNNWSVSQTFAGGAIFNGGNVGIGATTSTNKLDVWGNTRLAGNLTVDGTVISAPADLAEMYNVSGEADEGDLVELTSDPKIGFAVQKATNDSGNKILGIISTNPGSILGYNAALSNQKPVALAGRVPLKVSDENGPIKIGDYLTSSSIPGVAVKANTSGMVIGQALESFEGSLTRSDLIKSDNTNHLYYRHATIGKILSFVNVSFADPNNFLASLNFDDQGNLIVPKLKAGSIILDDRISKIENGISTIRSPSSTVQYYDLSGKIASLEDRIAALEEIASSSSTPQSDVIASEAKQSSSSAEIAASSSTPRDDVASLDLTPPDILLASSSASLADFSTTYDTTVLGLLTAYQVEIQDNFKVFGETTLGNTLIAGNLSVDGTLSFDNGNEINAISTLYLQKSPLSSSLDILNGKVTIDKEGNLRAQSVTVAEFKVVAGKISGSGKISSGTKSVEIENSKVKLSTRILITPTSETSLVLAVTQKVEDKKFTVSSPKETDKDILFDWFMVSETQNEN